MITSAAMLRRHFDVLEDCAFSAELTAASYAPKLSFQAKVTALSYTDQRKLHVYFTAVARSRPSTFECSANEEYGCWLAVFLYTPARCCPVIVPLRLEG